MASTAASYYGVYNSVQQRRLQRRRGREGHPADYAAGYSKLQGRATSQWVHGS